LPLNNQPPTIAIVNDTSNNVKDFPTLLPNIMILTSIIVVIVAVLLLGFRIAQEYQRAVVFRLGRFLSIKGPGLYWITPFIEREQRVDIRTKTVDLEQQETITKDSVTIKVNAVLWFKIIGPEEAIIKVADFNNAVYQFSVTALRNIIGQHSLDEVLREREQINETLQKIVDATTEPWGIKIEMVEMKDVEIPEGMQRAMAREAEAIREKRARIVKAEAELEASLKLTQGAKEMEGSPIALELRRMQMLSEIGIDNNTTTIVLVPSDFTNAAKSFTEMMNKKRESV
jgi:regulator of protease activity HflC (stomatin/prohibitin superfamily)